MLKTENISFSIDKKQILKNVSASFQPGEFNMVLGPNGSGKSSFLKIFSGEINKFDGSVFYDDKRIKEIKKGFNMSASTGITSEQDHWLHSYRHWKFAPTEFEADKA